MNYYLQDSGSVYWQISVSTSGQPVTTATGPQSITTLVLNDSQGGYWQLGVSTSGQLTTTSTGAAAVTTIEIMDSNGFSWSFGVTPLGQITTTLDIQMFDLTPGSSVCWSEF